VKRTKDCWTGRWGREKVVKVRGMEPVGTGLSDKQLLTDLMKNCLVKYL
jgi:hypothetical protein